MNNEVFFGKGSLRYYYYRFKDSSYYSITVILITLVVCVLLILQFILPQFDKWFSIRNEVIATRERIAIIEDNTGYMNTLNRNQLNSSIEIASLTLPPEKNFKRILDALNTAAFRTNVTLQDFDFHVGKVSALSSSQINNAGLKGISAVTLIVVVNNTVDETRKFINELSKTLPLSEVVSVDGASGSITITINFYQKQLPKHTLKDDKPIPHVVESNATLINKLASWRIPTNNARPAVSNGTQTGSTSAIPLF